MSSHSTDKSEPNSTQCVLWQCLDISGMDTCRFTKTPGGWQISGTAIHSEKGQINHLSYQLHCDTGWRCLFARVAGWTGATDRAVEFLLNDAGNWMVNGTALEGIDGLQDIDLGFTPATNTNAIRRLALQPGQRTETTALWLDTGDWTVKPLRQIYHRLTADRYAYVSPDHDYQTELLVDGFGIITEYPTLWRAV